MSDARKMLIALAALMLVLVMIASIANQPTPKPAIVKATPKPKSTPQAMTTPTPTPYAQGVTWSKILDDSIRDADAALEKSRAERVARADSDTGWHDDDEETP